MWTSQAYPSFCLLAFIPVDPDAIKIEKRDDRAIASLLLCNHREKIEVSTTQIFVLKLVVI